MTRFEYYGQNRYLCDVLEEMRDLFKTYNFSSMLSLIEEVQVIGSRMESSLGDLRDIKSLHNDIKIAKKELSKLRDEIENLETDKNGNNIKDEN